MMIDRTQEDISQDAKIADLAKRLQEQNQRLEHVVELVGNLQKILEPVAGMEDRMAKLIAPLLAKIQPLEETIGVVKAFIQKIRTHLKLPF